LEADFSGYDSVGVRDYYAKLGYYLEGPYMVKML
jgi:histone acetyltransferase (RNA polymerase elongator complex component)